MSYATFYETKICEIGESQVEFSIIAGPLVLQGEPLQDTYVVEISYKESVKSRDKTLYVEGFNKQTRLDYAKKARALALEFCEKHGFTLSHYSNSWPKFQAIVYVDPNKAIRDDAAGKIKNVI